MLQASNRLSLKELLNPVTESHVMDVASDKEIYHVVMETQHGNLLTNDDEDGPTDSPPTHCKALEAALVIVKYVETMEEPLAHTLEKDLGSFQHLPHTAEFKSMVPSRLTDYFTS
ncbi:hypothetical protein EDD16DRAFT_1468575 [Pisolithus croceorrhizus]|nr:hypothetical protein EV401DRAFT_1849689 [Pisolithus croceorrhizus]KAI6132590.1 hypothetical protein EDD16DRAFT_1468575 [Pisolithus croceorrhizus]